MNRFSKIAVAVGIMLFAVGFIAMADAPMASTFPGRLVPISQEVKDFFSARGVDPSYLGQDQSQVPADQWAKIEAILSEPSSGAFTPSGHDIVNDLVMSNLMLSSTGRDDPVYTDIGSSRWIYFLPQTLRM